MRHFNVKLIVDPAREMLGVLHSIKQGLPWKERALRLLVDKSYRYMLFSNNFSRQDLMEILESLSSGNEPVDQRLRWLHKELLGYLNRLDDISIFLDELENKKNEIVSEASEKARKCLPKLARIEADIYLVIGGSDAYGVNLLDTGAIVMNVGLFVSHMEEMITMMAHELHHKAENRSREIYWRFHRSGPKNLGRVYEIVSELIGEGIATLVTFPLGLAHKYFVIKEKISEEYKKVEDGIQQVYQNTTDERAKEIFETLYAHAGPLYMVGCDMAKKIENTLGKEELIAAAQEPLLFFQTYKKAVNKSGEGYEFSINTMKIIQKLQEKINLM